VGSTQTQGCRTQIAQENIPATINRCLSARGREFASVRISDTSQMRHFPDRERMPLPGRCDKTRHRNPTVAHGPPGRQIESKGCFLMAQRATGRRKPARDSMALEKESGTSAPVFRRRNDLHWVALPEFVANSSVKQIGSGTNSVPRGENSA
jgi:hypothetical protein